MLGEIGLDALDPRCLQRMGEADLLAEHRLGARHALCAGVAADADDDGAGLLGRSRPMHLSARGFRVALELGEVEAEIGDHVILDVAAEIAGGLELRPGRDGGGALRARRAGRAVDGELERRVGERLVDPCGEGGGHGSSPIAGPSPMPARTSAAW